MQTDEDVVPPRPPRAVGAAHDGRQKEAQSVHPDHDWAQFLATAELPGGLPESQEGPDACCSGGTPILQPLHDGDATGSIGQ